MKHLAFTGTQRGMTDAQHCRFGLVLAGFPVGWFHHGDCIGADAEAHDVAQAYGHLVHIHPCDIPSKRAWCSGAVAMAQPMPPLDRNRVMVDYLLEPGEALIACPGSMVEELRSGTWATIRYARKQRKPVHIIWPDGSYVAPPP